MVFAEHTSRAVSSKLIKLWSDLLSTMTEGGVWVHLVSMLVAVGLSCISCTHETLKLGTYSTFRARW